MFIQTRLKGDANQKIDQAAENTFYMPTVYNNDGGGGGDFVPVID
jgi:hypothetical protein